MPDAVQQPGGEFQAQPLARVPKFGLAPFWRTTLTAAAAQGFMRHLGHQSQLAYRSALCFSFWPICSPESHARWHLLRKHPGNTPYPGYSPT